MRLFLNKYEISDELFYISNFIQLITSLVIIIWHLLLLLLLLLLMLITQGSAKIT